MEWVSIVIGWAIAKLLDKAHAALVQRILPMVRRQPFGIFRKKYVLELEHKARALELLKKSFDAVSRVEGELVKPAGERPTWRQ